MEKKRNRREKIKEEERDKKIWTRKRRRKREKANEEKEDSGRWKRRKIVRGRRK